MSDELQAEIAKLRFLVVEDHGFQRWALGDLLKRMGATDISMAADGFAALEILGAAGAPIDIIVSDLDMPGMDGMEFLRHLSGMQREASVILTTGHDRALLSSVETMARAYGVRLLAAVEKPTTGKMLLEAIERHLGRKPLPEAPESGRAAFTLEEILEGLRLSQFEPFLQPKVDMRTREVVGAEALARWRHPAEGLVMPRDFVPILEAAGRSEDLTAEMLRKAAISCRAWREQGRDATVSVNLAPESLADVKLAERLTAIVASEGLASRQVIFEVTESAMTMELGRTLENLSRLRMKGFGLAIDDYGTGYSSMQQLTRIPFTELKIDQSFVQNAATQSTSHAMVESSLEMAGKLKIAAVAEGVETQAQWELLKSLGCAFAQGFHIARPIDHVSYDEWLSRE